VNREKLTGVLVFVVLVAVGVLTRLWSNAAGLWNFDAVLAASLFAGFYLSHRIFAALVPLAIMVISNFELPQYETLWLMLSIYAVMMLPVLFRGILRQRMNVLTVGGTALGSGLLFFVLSNFAHWWFMVEPQTWETLTTTFAAALPFAKGTFGGVLLWSAIFFGSYSLATRYGWLKAPQRLRRVPAVS